MLTFIMNPKVGFVLHNTAYAYINSRFDLTIQTHERYVSHTGQQAQQNSTDHIWIVVLDSD